MAFPFQNIGAHSFEQSHSETSGLFTVLTYSLGQVSDAVDILHLCPDA